MLMKRYGWMLGLMTMATLAGCRHQPSGQGYSPRYDGLSGRTAAAVNMRILKNQGTLYTAQHTPQPAAGGAAGGQ